VALLTAHDKAALMAVGTLVRMPKGAVAYRAFTPADCVYNLVEGVLKTSLTLPDASTHISAFHFAGDVFGMAEQGQYVESAEAIVPVAAYKIRLAEFEMLLARDGGLAVRMLCKLTDDLRRKQRHALILDRPDAVGKMAMFLLLLADAGQARGAGSTTYFPMLRSDAANYVGLTLEAVSRALHALEKQGVVEFVDRHHFHVLDRTRLQALSAGTIKAPPVSKLKKAKPLDAAIDEAMRIVVKERRAK
jgi:CRP-like cAMP-binding protein